jgi:GDP-D-mannose dehydratase
LIRGKLLDLFNLRVLEKIRPEEIYNLATQGSIGLSFEQGSYQI